jgi:hypothetical protein
MSEETVNVYSLLDEAQSSANPERLTELFNMLPLEIFVETDSHIDGKPAFLGNKYTPEKIRSIIEDPQTF